MKAIESYLTERRDVLWAQKKLIPIGDQVFRAGVMGRIYEVGLLLEALDHGEIDTNNKE